MKPADLANTLASLDRDEVDSFADINGKAVDLAIALHQRYGCRIDLIGLNQNGRFSEMPEKDVAAYIDKAREKGVAENAIRTVAARRLVQPYDVIAALDGFGTHHKISGLRHFLGVALHGQSRLVIEVRKGSGSYPFLNKYGGCNTLVVPTPGQPGLAILSVEPKPEAAGEWSKIARELAGRKGFFTDCQDHSFLYVPRGDTLVVTFDNLDIAMTKREDRRPWGFEFIKAQGWSMLGVMANGWTWFRDKAVCDEFDRLRDSGFFRGFRRVVFYGASMGGYAAAAYSAAAPGATVFVISPQSTLDKSVVPWEKRYKNAWGRDFSGPYGDAALSSRQADKVHLMFDPYVVADAAHAARFTGENVKHWRCPLLGHRLGSSLAQMGVLQDIARRAIAGELDERAFYGFLRKRRDFPRYQRELANLALNRGRPDLAARVCRYVLNQREDAFFSNLLKRIAE